VEVPVELEEMVWKEETEVVPSVELEEVVKEKMVVEDRLE
jgi:hypothetical protein